MESKANITSTKPMDSSATNSGVTAFFPASVRENRRSPWYDFVTGMTLRSVFTTNMSFGSSSSWSVTSSYTSLMAV